MAKLIAKIISLGDRVSLWFRRILSGKYRSKAQLSGTNAAIDSVNQLANEMQKEGNFSKLECALEKMTLNNMNQLERQSWYLFYGITAMHRNEHHEALKRFKQGVEHYPLNQELRFSLGQEYIYLNKPEKAFREFDLCKFPTLANRYILTMSNFCYLFNEYGRGVEYLNQFVDIYLKLKILDDTFLYIRGLPFFSTVWNDLATTSRTPH